MHKYLLTVILFTGLTGLSQENKEIRTEMMAAHSLSFNPFFIPLLSPSVRYNWYFTPRRHWALNVRTTYVSQIVNFFSNDNSYLIQGVGIKYIPLYYKILALGVDFTPTYIIELFPDESSKSGWLLPISAHFDFLLSKRIGGTLDFGVGYLTGDVLDQKIVPRGHVGIMFMFGESKFVYPQNNSKF